MNECDVCNILCLTPARLPRDVKLTVEALVFALDLTLGFVRLRHPGHTGEGGPSHQEEGEDHLGKHHSVSAPLWTLF